MKYGHPNLKIIIQLDLNRNEAGKRLEREKTLQKARPIQ